LRAADDHSRASDYRGQVFNKFAANTIMPDRDGMYAAGVM